METPLRLLGVFIFVDLFVAFGLVGLVWIVGRRRAPIAEIAGVLIALGICSALIYGGLWMILNWTWQH